MNPFVSAKVATQQQSSDAKELAQISLSFTSAKLPDRFQAPAGVFEKVAYARLFLQEDLIQRDPHKLICTGKTESFEMTSSSSLDWKS